MSHIAFGEKKTMADVWPIKNKRFFVRTDFERLVEHGTQQPPHTLLTTILKVVAEGGKAIIGCSFGVNKNAIDIKVTSAQRQQAIQAFPAHLSTRSLADLLTKLLPDGTSVDFAPDCLAAQDAVKKMQRGSVLVLQNLRFYRAELSEKAEERLEMAQLLARYTDVFVNDVFATLHLNAAATVELPRILKHGVCGELMAQEVTYFSQVLTNPRRPLTLVIGSVHIEEKMRLLEALVRKVDKVLVGAAVAIPFMQIAGIGTGKLSSEICDSTGRILWSDATSTPEVFARKILRLAEKYNVKIVLPDDFTCHTSIEPTRFPTISPQSRVPSDQYIVDVGPKTIQRFTAEIRDSNTVFWTGRMGCAKKTDYTNGTMAIANAIGHSNCISVVGGKNTVSAVRAAGVEDCMSHMTTGPNSMLRVLDGTSLPALNALSDAYPPVASDINVTAPQLLRCSALFKDLAAPQLRVVLAKVVPRVHQKGDVLVHEGDRITSMFIVARGFLHGAPRSQQGKSIAERVIGVGGCVGEFSFLNGRVSTDVVQAATDGTMTFQLTSAALEEAMIEYPDVAVQVLKCAVEPVRIQASRDRQKKWSEWQVLATTLHSTRKPNPWGDHSRVGDILAAVIPSIVLHQVFTLQYTPYVETAATCFFARFGGGVIMKAAHNAMRELLYGLLPKDGEGFSTPTVAGILASVAFTPLRLAATGRPFLDLGRREMMDSALTSAALSTAPALSHALFLFRKSAAEASAWRRKKEFGSASEVLLAAACRAIVSCCYLPLVAHRNGGVGMTFRGAIAYVLRQVVSLLIETITLRLWRRWEARRAVSSPITAAPHETPLSLMQQRRAAGEVALW